MRLRFLFARLPARSRMRADAHAAGELTQIKDQPVHIRIRDWLCDASMPRNPIRRSVAKSCFEAPEHAVSGHTAGIEASGGCSHIAIEIKEIINARSANLPGRTGWDAR